MSSKKPKIPSQTSNSKNSKHKISKANPPKTQALKTQASKTQVPKKPTTAVSQTTTATQSRLSKTQAPPGSKALSSAEAAKRIMQSRVSNSLNINALSDRMTQELNQSASQEQRNVLDQAKQIITFAKRRQEQLEHFRREDLFDELRSNAFFQKLQSDFFRSILPIPENITRVLADSHNKFNQEQILTLGEIGQTFRKLPFDFLSEKITAEDCYKKTVETLKKQANFFSLNPEVLQNTATHFLKSYLPFGNFLGQALEEVLKSGLGDIQKQTLQRAINGSLNALELVTNTIEQAPSIVLSLGGELLLQELPQQLFKVTLPIPAAITQILISFHDSLSKEQKQELADIGKNFATLPLDLLMAKVTPVQCFERISEGLTRFAGFFLDNPEILVKTASHFIKSFVPFGNFLSGALEAVVTSDFSEPLKKPLSQAINGALSSFGALGDILKQAPKIARDLGFDF